LCPLGLAVSSGVVDLAFYHIMHSKNTRIVLTEFSYLSCNWKAAKDKCRGPNIPFWGFIQRVRL